MSEVMERFRYLELEVVAVGPYEPTSTDSERMERFRYLELEVVAVGSLDLFFGSLYTMPKVRHRF
jgi:hypothetical protein